MSRARAARLTAALASGVLLALSRPPTGWDVIAWFALVPLVIAWRGDSVRGAALSGFVGGVGYFGVLVSWAWYFGAVALVPFVAVLACYWLGVAALVACFAARGIRSPLLTAAVWVLGEALLARWPFGGFSWGEVGVAFVDVPAARELAALGGVALVSFVAVALQAAVAEALASRGAPRVRRWELAGAAIVVAVPLVGVATVGSSTSVSGTLRFAMVQGNDLNRDLTRAEEAARYLPESHFRLASDLDAAEALDLVVFPESSMDEDPRVDRYLADELTATARRLDAWVLANATADAPDGRADNLNVLYDPSGDLVGTYSKRHLVPYGEYVPFRAVLDDWIGALDRIPRDYAPGDEPGIFPIAGRRVATIICFESAFSHEVRPLVRDGAEAIVVTTNNRSYRRSGNSAQHLQASRMRAAETDRPVLHASISGITAVIDAGGDLQTTTELFERTVVRGEIETRTGDTLYVRLGEWIVLLALVATVVAAVAVRRGRRSVDSTPMTAGERT
ncbi:MAG TPA: apolipoprotein N-acyltransferase [Acidimicrobiia bacterium]|nr:apolipoprotein N-acyltransferase [Acidimicrobiia bacterium]